MKAAPTRHILEFALLRAAVLTGGRLSPRMRSFLAHMLGVIVFDAIRLRRRVVVANLARTMGDSLSTVDRRRLGRRCYQQLALSGLEIAALVGKSPADLVDICRIEGWEHLEILLEQRTGAILVTGHLGNWELLAAALGSRGVPLSAVGAPMRNKLVDRWLGDFRTRFGMELIPTGRASARAALRALRRGRMLLLLIDQDARRGGVFVEFFGTPASTRTGAAALAGHAGVPILPCRIRREGHDRHVITVMPAMAVSAADGGAGAVTSTMQEITRLLESWIREDPAAWFWPHRRFKTQPICQSPAQSPGM